MGVSENVVYPIVPNGFADHYPVFKWLFHWEYTQHFQTNPKSDPKVTIPHYPPISYLLPLGNLTLLIKHSALAPRTANGPAVTAVQGAGGSKEPSVAGRYFCRGVTARR